MRQQSFRKQDWKHRFSYGGSLRNRRCGRGARPLSSREPLHLVFKANRWKVRGGFRHHKRFALILQLLQKYQAKFFIKVDQYSIQGDHMHFLIRTTKRSNYQNFFRVLAGQIAQQLEKEELLTVVTDTPAGEQAKHGLWKQRPFTRIVRGWRGYQIVRDYIQLNEKEALGQIPYRKERLKGLSMSEWQLLWG